MGDQQDAVQAERVEEGENICRDVLLRPAMQSAARTSRIRAGRAR